MELLSCPNLAVPVDVMHHVVRVESSYNPYAIGVVGGHLVRQPKTVDEALATVRMLESRGFNFSLGLAQVNRYNLSKYGLDSYEKAFETCPNMQAGSRILAECYNRSGRDWGKSFSCYYSGNFVTGYRHGYVQKIYASIRGAGAGNSRSATAPAIEVVSKPSRRTVQVTRYPVYAAPQPSGKGRIIASLPPQTPPQNLLPQASVPSGAPVQAPVVLEAAPQRGQLQKTEPAAVVVSSDAAPQPATDAAFVF
ncbi:MAG TPA: transglycosylase SLT domain-containing protein [Pseudoxanthomonas sp.]